MTHWGQSSPDILSRASSPSRQKRGRLRARIYDHRFFLNGWGASLCHGRAFLYGPSPRAKARTFFLIRGAATHCSACAKHPMVAGRTSTPMDEALFSFERVWFGANFPSSLDGPNCTSEEGTSRSTQHPTNPHPQPSRTAPGTSSAPSRTARKTTSNWPWVYIRGPSWLL